MGRYARMARALGAGVIGSCCGSGAGHVHRMGCELAEVDGVADGVATSSGRPLGRPSEDEIRAAFASEVADLKAGSAGEESPDATESRRARAAKRAAARAKKDAASTSATDDT